MGDRAPVTITVPIEYKEEVIQLLEQELDQPDDYWGNTPPTYVVLHYDGVNCAQIKSLDQLTKSGIAYDYEWGEGGGFSAGEESIRFTVDGDIIFTSDEQIKRSRALDSFYQLAESSRDLTELMVKIQKEIHTVVPINWENQVAYGQLYCAKQLINPTKE